jgi:hypothetical protein
MKVLTEKLEYRSITDVNGKNGIYHMLNYEMESGEGNKIYLGKTIPQEFRELKKGDSIVLRLELYEAFGKLNLKVLGLKK